MNKQLSIVLLSSSKIANKKTKYSMSHVVTDNPFKVEHYSYSWSDARKYTDNLINRFSENYKLAYYNDFHQKIIILIKGENNSLETGNPQILTITKIDDSKDLCLLAF